MYINYNFFSKKYFGIKHQLKDTYYYFIFL